MDNFRFDIGIAIFYCFMIGRFAYYAYMKGPKEITRLQSENRDADVEKWQKFIDRCKINIGIFAGIGLLSIVLLVGNSL